jgi:NAD(P)-dependent dehydrogenase (short-subunit alcohol dehydrogenase family)
MPDTMKGQAALVTGASSGIGRATALKFASEGAEVGLVARHIDRLQVVAEAVAEAGGRGYPIAADLTDTDALDACFERAMDSLGGLDVLVNAAGIIASGTIETTPLDQWEQMFAINTRAPFRLMQKAMPHLAERKGSVVNVSSVTGLRSFPGILSYCASKAAVDQLTRCAALEMAPKGVRVNAVNPGVVVTQLHRAGMMDEPAYADFLEHSKTTHPLGRVGQPEEVADLIAFLVSPQAGWITGVTYEIDGGRFLTCAR